MAVSQSVLRVPASSSSFDARLARLFPAKVNKNTSKSQPARGTRVKKAVPKGALMKELAALGIEIDEDEDEDSGKDTKTQESLERRYDLRGRDKNHKMLGSAPVTKPSRSKVVKLKDDYDGPGYLGKSPKITKKGQECVICAETQGR